MTINYLIKQFTKSLQCQYKRMLTLHAGNASENYKTSFKTFYTYTVQYIENYKKIKTVKN